MRRLWLLPVLLCSSAALAAPPPYVDSYYNDSYKVFVGANNLQRARQLVEEALYWRPDDPVWVKRLAIVTGWQGDTEASLAAWYRLARLDDSLEAWQHVMDLAPGTFNDQLLLEARRRLLRERPGDPDLIEAIGHDYELLGRPDAGMAFLDKWRLSHPSKGILMTLQRLAQGSGQDLRAAGYDREYMRRYGPTEELALHCADLLWLHGDRQKAYQGLRRDAGGLPYSARITRRLALMATQLGDWPAAMRAYQTLTDKGDATASDGYDYLNLAYFAAPDQVPEILRRMWHNTDREDFALSYLYAVTDRGNTRAAAAFFKELKPEDLQRLSRNPSFVGLYAGYLQDQGRPGRARELMRQALGMETGKARSREAWLSLLIVQGEDRQLAADLARWEPEMRAEPSYWGILSAAHMALNQPRQALVYQSLLLKDDPNSWKQRWLYCQVLLAAGEADRAWPLLRELWRHPPAPDQIVETDRPLYDEVRIALAGRFGNGDDQLRFMGREIAHAPPAERAQRADWLAQWALGQDATELARLWYLRERGWLSGGLPPSAALALATLDDDRLAIAEIRDRHAGLLSTDERIQADETLGRERLAAAELARQQHDAPALAEANGSGESLLLSTANSLSLGGERRRLGPLDADFWQFNSLMPFAERWDWTLHFEQQRFTSNDRELLRVDESGQRVDLGLHRRSRLWDTRVEVGERFIFGYSKPNATVTVGGQPRARWRWQWRGEWHTSSDETADLLLAGLRTGQKLALIWNPSSAWENTLSAAHYRYNDVIGNALGQGNLYDLQSTWYPWPSIYSPGLRLRQTVDAFKDQRPLGRSLGITDSTGVAVPESYNETELSLLFGMPDSNVLPHRTHAWGELGVTRNNLYGTGFNGRLGAEGPVIGRDAWRVYLEKSINTGGANQDSYRLGFEYRFYY